MGRNSERARMGFELEGSSEGYRCVTDLKETRYLLGTRSVWKDAGILLELFAGTLLPLEAGPKPGTWLYRWKGGEVPVLKRLPRAGAVSRSALDLFEGQVSEYRTMRERRKPGLRHSDQALLSEFRLPDPRSNPMFYRLAVLSDGSERLVILWGLTPGDSSPGVDPVQALDLLKRAPSSDESKTREKRPFPIIPVLGGGLILGLLGLIVLSGWPSKPQEEVVSVQEWEWSGESSLSRFSGLVTRVDVPGGGVLKVNGRDLFRNGDIRSHRVQVFSAKEGIFLLELMPDRVPEATPVLRWIWEAGASGKEPFLHVEEAPFGGMATVVAFKHRDPDWERTLPDSRLFLFVPGNSLGMELADGEEQMVSIPEETVVRPLLLLEIGPDGLWEEDRFYLGGSDRFPPLTRIELGGWRKGAAGYEACVIDSGSWDPEGRVVGFQVDWGDGTHTFEDYGTMAAGGGRHVYGLRAYRPEIGVRAVDEAGRVSQNVVRIPENLEPEELEFPELAKGRKAEVFRIPLVGSDGLELAWVHARRFSFPDSPEYRYEMELLPRFTHTFAWIADLRWEVFSAGIKDSLKVRDTDIVSFVGGSEIALRIAGVTDAGTVRGSFVFPAVDSGGYGRRHLKHE